MQTAIAKRQTFEDFNIKYNETSVKKLFKMYKDIGFMYPAKMALLKPHLKQITSNWKTLVESKEALLWILTNDPAEDNFASVSVWKQNNHGLLAQHLVSDGNPFLSLKVMLAAQFKAEHHYTANQVQSSQNWFRPNNRYAYRIFASMLEKLGPKNAALTLFHYLHLSLDQISDPLQNDYVVEKVTGVDSELIHFVNQQYGEVFLAAEELGKKDIQLSAIGDTFKKYGLKRSRKVLKIKDRYSQKVVACVVANRAPLGLNFSFLENRAYYIVDKNLEEQELTAILKIISKAIRPYYEDFELQMIPIVTDPVTSKILQKQKAIFLREYMQSIWMRSGFPMWFEHIQSFLQRIERRKVS